MIASKSPDELRKWRNIRKRSLNHLITVVGDKPMTEVTRHDALEFRRWWLDRIAAEQLMKSSANKEVSTLTGLWTALIERHMLDIDNPFTQLRLRGEQAGKRQAFDPKFVETRILAPGALEPLNREARGIIYLVAALGVRPKEAAAARPDDVHLDADIPYWHVAPGATGKTAYAERTLPLHGLALEVWRSFPDGFPRYLDSPDSFSATANKALLDRGLRPTQNHTVYSLRHTFQDLLTNAEVPERIDRDLFGHTLNRIEYGAGADLKTKLKWLKKVAYKVKRGLVS